MSNINNQTSISQIIEQLNNLTHTNLLEAAELKAKEIIKKAENERITILREAKTQAKKTIRQAGHQAGQIKEKADTHLKEQQNKASVVLANVIEQKEQILGQISDVKTLMEAKEKLTKDKQALEGVLTNYKIEEEELKDTLADLNTKMNKFVKGNDGTGPITLNVGGRIFKTLKINFQNKAPYLEAIISGNHKTEKDKDGNIFIDRDPELFAKVLFYLRTGDLTHDIYDELEYYGVPEKIVDDLREVFKYY